MSADIDYVEQAEADQTQTDQSEADAQQTATESADTAPSITDSETKLVESRVTNRWTGISAIALFAAGIAILIRQPGLLVASAIGVAFTAYAHRGRPSSPSLAVTRDLSTETPDPGAEVEVTVEVHNTGDTTLPDLRIVDGVPHAFEVVDGSPRLGTALRPGKYATFTYTVVAVRGEHEWAPMQVLARDAAGTHEQELEVTAGTTLRSSPSLIAGADLPLRDLTTQYTGRMATDVTGSGLEFTSIREYRSGDPLKRIDWNRWARTGERATVQYREERAATVVLLIDAREQAYVAPDDEAEHAVERSINATQQLFITLGSGGDRVGLAALSPESCWLAPGAGADHRARARELLTTTAALAPTPPEKAYLSSVQFQRLRRRLPSDAQVIFFTPLVDDHAVDTARRLDAYGHLVTVVSPDATAAETPGQRLEQLARRNRVSRLRRAGLRVVDWGDESLASAIASATRRWSR